MTFMGVVLDTEGWLQSRYDDCKLSIEGGHGPSKDVDELTKEVL